MSVMRCEGFVDTESGFTFIVRPFVDLLGYSCSVDHAVLGLWARMSENSYRHLTRWLNVEKFNSDLLAARLGMNERFLFWTRTFEYDVNDPDFFRWIL